MYACFDLSLLVFGCSTLIGFLARTITFPSIISISLPDAIASFSALISISGRSSETGVPLGTATIVPSGNVAMTLSLAFSSKS